MDLRKVLSQNPIEATPFKTPEQELDNAVSDIVREMSLQEQRLNENIGNVHVAVSKAAASAEAASREVDNLGQAFDQFDDDFDRAYNRTLTKLGDLGDSVETASYKIDELRTKASKSLSPAVVLSVTISVLNLILCCIIVSMVSQ